MNKKEKIGLNPLKNLGSLNPKKEPLTVEKFKEIMKRPDMPDHEAEEAVLSIRTLCSIVVDVQMEMEEKRRSKEKKE